MWYSPLLDRLTISLSKGIATYAKARLFLLATFSRPLSRCDPCSFCPLLLHCFCAGGLASIAYPCRERQCTSTRQGKVREMQAWNAWTWLKNVSGSLQTPYEQVVNRVTA